ncbi:ribose-phosphate diphosphokinase [Rhodothalassium salexigens]|uniref:ribose-phosphate diphosphokinase n=1 Tax=Rhodothalassium salexigens TaxID=1086 RepID=UPI001911DEA0|nr:ribose-phosphate diphosphokinase [Rhodothalassium salexigens]
MVGSMMPGAVAMFALDASRVFGAAVAAALGQPLLRHEERRFADGEHKVRPLDPVRGGDVYVLQSLHGGPDLSADDKLCRLLFFLGAVRDAGAARLTAVVPYLAYARKDRRTQARDPVTTRYVAQLFEAVGVDRVVAVEVHNLVAFQNAFRCPVEHLDTRRLFIDALVNQLPGGPLAVASPDPGGVKRAQLFREMLEARTGRAVEPAFMEKRRSGGVVGGTLLTGQVRDATVIVVDDLIASGGTMVRAAEACRAAGATQVFALAAHGLFVGDAAAALTNPALSTTWVTDTVPPFRLEATVLAGHVQVVSAAPLVARAIARLHGDGSIVDLLGNPG